METTKNSENCILSKLLKLFIYCCMLRDTPIVPLKCELTHCRGHQLLSLENTKDQSCEVRQSPESEDQPILPS